MSSLHFKAFVLILLCIPSQRTRSQDALPELLHKIEVVQQSIPEGYAKATVRTFDGTRDVSCWWVHDTTLRHYGDQGGPKIHLLAADDTLSAFRQESHSCRIVHRASRSKPPRATRIIPRECCFEIVGGVSIVRFIQKNAGDPKFSVRKRDTGGYLLTRDKESKLQLYFSSDGRPESFSSTTSEPDVATSKGRYVFKSEHGDYLPVRIERYVRKNNKADWTADFVCEYHEFSSVLPDDHPSLEIPAADLPFGTLVMNRAITGMPKSYYVGGNDGKLQFQLIHVAKELRPLLHDGRVKWLKPQ